MHILMTADTVGGVWTYALDLIRALPGHHFSLATMGELPTSAQRKAAQELPNAALFESGWKLEWMEQPWDDVARAGDWLLELERELHPDVVHLNGYAHGALPFVAPVVVVAHSCVLSWWRAVKGEEAPPEWGTYRSAVERGLCGANRVIAPTAAMLQELWDIYGDFGTAGVIWNGAAMTGPETGRKHSFVLTAGRLWDEAKNIELLDGIAPRVAWPIKVAGQTNFGQEQFDAPNLHLLGVLKPARMRQTMSEASIWAHPARYEPFGLAVLEAALAGCVLVLSDIPTLRELWEGAAFFISPDDAPAWEQTLQTLIFDPALRRDYGARAHARAHYYGLDRCAHNYAALYNELI